MGFTKNTERLLNAGLKHDSAMQGSSAESRKQIESRTPSTPLGTLELDASDVTEVEDLKALEKRIDETVTKHAIE